MRKQIKKIKALRHDKGFTLIELMAVLAILAVIVAIAVPAIGTVMAKSQASAEKSGIELMERAGELAHLDGLELETVGSSSERYTIPTLVKEGYLKLSDDSVYYDARNYVTRESNGTFTYNEDGPLVPEDVIKTTFGLSEWTVPVSGVYELAVWGARGGAGGAAHVVMTSGRVDVRPGALGIFGDTAKTQIRLDAGDQLTVRVGGEGGVGPYGNDTSGRGGGGGGSSAIAYADSVTNLILSAAGGKGGNGMYDGDNHLPYGAGGVGGFNDGQPGVTNRTGGGAGGGTTKIGALSSIVSGQSAISKTVNNAAGKVQIKYISE